MIGKLAMVFGSRIVASEDIYPSSLEYRIYQIKTIHEHNEAIAIIYDGEREVQREYGKDYHQAIAHAKAWIDEQDEMAEEFDLHVEPANI